MDLAIIAIIVSVVNMIFMIITFALTRKDKAVDDIKKEKSLEKNKEVSKEVNYALIEYKIDELKEDFAEFAGKFDKFENEIDNRIAKAIDTHVKMYHSKG